MRERERMIECEEKELSFIERQQNVRTAATLDVLTGGENVLHSSIHKLS